MTTQQIDRKLLQAIRPRIETALTDIANEFGISIKAGRGQYADEYGHLKLEFATVSDSGVVMTKEAADYKENAGQWGDLKEFDPAWLFTEFEHGGEAYKLMGYRTRATKKNIMLLRLSDNTTRIAPSVHVLRGLEVTHGAYKKEEN